MLPCTAKPGPVRWPAQSRHSVPVNAAARPSAVTTPSWRVSRPGSSASTRSSASSGVAPRCDSFEREPPVDRDAGRLRRDGADARPRPRHDRADREVLRLHGAADLAGLEIGRHDREGRLTRCGAHGRPQPSHGCRSDCIEHHARERFFAVSRNAHGSRPRGTPSSAPTCRRPSPAETSARISPERAAHARC